MEGLRRLTVDPFPTSSERPKIFAELERLLVDLASFSFIGEVWINGSFVTEKISPEPDDIDLTVTAHIYDLCRQDQHFLDFYLKVINGSKGYSPLLDTYICVIFPKDDPRHRASKEGYWANKWSVGWDDKLKGFAVLKLGESDAWFNLFT